MKNSMMTYRTGLLLCIFLFPAPMYTANERLAIEQHLLKKVAVFSDECEPKIQQRRDCELGPDTVRIRVERPNGAPLIYSSEQVFFKLPGKKIAMSLTHFLRLLGKSADQIGHGPEFEIVKELFFHNDSTLTKFDYRGMYEMASKEGKEASILFTARIKRKKTS